MSETSTNADSDSDDLDIAYATRRRLERSDKSKTPITIELSDSEHASPQPAGDAKPTPGIKVEWSADEDDHPRDRLKQQLTRKRKKTARGGRRKTARTDDNPTDAKQSDASDEGMEDRLPEYLVQRRRRFDQRVDELREAGLRLPPSSDDVDFSDDERLADLAERPRFQGRVTPCRAYRDIPLTHSGGVIPASIAQYLRDYQVDGVAFLHQRFVWQQGAILGDDMGLGKTVQVAAFLTVAFGKTGDERDGKRMRKMRRSAAGVWYPKVLVVCPGSLIANWTAELQRWGWWHVDAFHGDDKEAVFHAAQSGRLEIVVTTYTTYRNHRDRLNLIEWDCVIADECHQLKDPSTDSTKAMQEVNALCRIGLTGTAIQNNYSELWTLLNWTSPGELGTQPEWNATISVPLRMGQAHHATVQELSTARATARQLVENLLPRFFLRRTKALIAHQLPKKTDRVVFCPLTDLQAAAYERFLDSPIVDFVRSSSDMCACRSGKKSGWCCNKVIKDQGEKWQSLVFPVIASLQKLSNHLALLIPREGDAREKGSRELQFLKDMLPEHWEELYKNRDSITNLSNPEFCGKWRVLKKLLKFWYGNGDKVLVFSHSVRLLQMLRHLFHHTSYNVSYLDGSLPYSERTRVVDEFNADARQFVFLISTKAGGVGLNITSANKVVIMDPNWNPAWDLQAQDRAYRIGQVRDVEVFRLVSAGTLEEIVYARQIYKQQQANIGYNASLERRYFKGVQNNPAHKGEIFGLQNMLTFHVDMVLRDIVHKANVAEARAGVELVNVELNADDDLFDNDPGAGDAISQLAAFLTDERSRPKKEQEPKTNAIQAILASAGVDYTHENSEVIGSSKVEAHLSWRAEQSRHDAAHGEDVYFQSLNRTAPAGQFQYIYHPPPDVVRRQFCTMSRMMGFDSATEFALVVEGWTQEQRRRCLERFYEMRRKHLQELEMQAVAQAETQSEAEDDAGSGVMAGDVTDSKADCKTDAKADGSKRGPKVAGDTMEDDETESGGSTASDVEL